MSPPPTLDIDELDRLEKAATPGPWTRAKPGSDPDGFTRGVAIGATYGRNMIYANPPVGQFPSSDANVIVALRNAAPALIEAARERDRLREELKAAEEFVANELELRLGEMRSDHDMAEARSCLALIRSALGTDGEGK